MNDKTAINEAPEALDIEALLKESPLIGVSDRRMKKLRERGRIAQFAIRDAMGVFMKSGMPPEIAFAAAAQALVSQAAMSQDRYFTAYLVHVLMAIREGGSPMMLMTSVLDLNHIQKAGEEMPEEMKAYYGRTTAPGGTMIKDGDSGEVIADTTNVVKNLPSEGSVIHAEGLFGKPRTVH
jgi:hypothetical protein